MNATATATASKNALELRSLGFFYGKFRACAASRTSPSTRVTAFIAPSGCGKSTLLRTLNRMYSLYPASVPRAPSASTAGTSGPQTGHQPAAPHRHSVPEAPPFPCPFTTTSRLV